MDQATKDRIRQEIEDEVRTLFGGAVRRVDWESHSNDPHFEPGELLPSLILTEPSGRIGRPGPGAAFKKLQRAHGPALKQFRRDLAQRWPEVQHLGFGYEDARATAGAAASSWASMTRAKRPRATSST